ncbi:3-isopropylmalate dehydratase small subunit [Candidatus Latescibacterota bacterium]
MKGKAYLYERDHINTDEIIPARYLVTDDEEELALHAMEDLDNNFVHHFKVGDFIVAGNDFGCGSSREHAIWALRGAGVACVVAESFARIFYRNAINNGFAVVECKDIIKDVAIGDILEIDLKRGILKNDSTGKVFEFMPISDFALNISKAGGLLQAIKRNTEK